MFYVVEHDANFYVGSDLLWENLNDCMHFGRTRESWLTSPDLKIHLAARAELDPRLPDYFFCGLVNAVSSEVRNVFDQFEFDVEYLEIEFTNISPTKTYFAMHVQSLIDAVDRRMSIIGGEKYGLPAGIKKLVIDENRTLGKEVFIVESLGAPLVVRSSVAHELKSHAFTGMDVFPVGQYCDAVTDLRLF